MTARDRAAAVAASKAPKSNKPAGTPIPPRRFEPKMDAVVVLRHPDHPEITVRFELVTPALAERYLASSPDWQRNPSEATVDEYADDMIDRDWWFTGDALRFTMDDDVERLFDGQHRCRAIVASGQSQMMLVIRGLNREVMRVLDTGLQRKFTHYLSTRKVPNIAGVAGITAKVLDWRRGNYAYPNVARVPNARHLRAKKSHQKLIHTFEDMRDEIITAVRRGYQIYSRFPGSAPSTTFGFAYLLLGRYDPYKCEEFFTELVEGSRSADPTHPIRALEKTLTTRSNERLPSYTWLSWIILAWNQWIREEPLSRERFRSIKNPKFNMLNIPEDPHQLERPEGWEPL